VISPPRPRQESARTTAAILLILSYLTVCQASQQARRKARDRLGRPGAQSILERATEAIGNWLDKRRLGQIRGQASC